MPSSTPVPWLTRGWTPSFESFGVIDKELVMTVACSFDREVVSGKGEKKIVSSHQRSYKNVIVLNRVHGGSPNISQAAGFFFLSTALPAYSFQYLFSAGTLLIRRW